MLNIIPLLRKVTFQNDLLEKKQKKLLRSCATERIREKQLSDLDASPNSPVKACVSLAGPPNKSLSPTPCPQLYGTTRWQMPELSTDSAWVTHRSSPYVFLPGWHRSCSGLCHINIKAKPKHFPIGSFSPSSTSQSNFLRSCLHTSSTSLPALTP